MTEKRIKVTKKFREDFELVTKFYEMPPEEIEWLRNQARSNYEMVKQSLAETAGRIRVIQQVEVAA